jgi:hypothetical protein
VLNSASVYLEELDDLIVGAETLVMLLEFERQTGTA